MTSMAYTSRLDSSLYPVEPVISVTTIVLILLGVVMVASASSEISAKIYGQPFYLLGKHLVFLTVSLAVAIGVMMIPLRYWQITDWFWLLVSFALLTTVLVPGIGREVNGSVRWIPLGVFSIQGSEFAKFFVCLYIPHFFIEPLVEKFPHVRCWRDVYLGAVAQKI